MDYINDIKNDDVDRNSRTLWVGNLHPKVPNETVAELFYQVGPIEFIEFAYDEHELSQNFAWITFKYRSSVEDSIKLLQGTTLYGSEIIIKKYSEELKDPVFDDQLNYFKQLVNDKRSSQSNNGNRSRWNDQNSENQSSIPDTLPEPPTHGKYNSNHDRYDHRSETISKNSYKDESSNHHSNSYSKNRNPDYGNEYQPFDKSHHSREHYRKSECNSRSSSIVSSHDRNSYTHNYDYKRQKDYDMGKESNYYNQEYLHSNKSFPVKDELPVRDLRDTIHGKHTILNSEYHSGKNANAACTSTLDLRDTMYHGKNNKYRDTHQSCQLESKIRWSDRKKNVHGSGGFSGKPYHKDNYTSERYDESNTKQTNHYFNQEYYIQNFSHNKPYKSFPEHGKDYPNNFDGYNREKNRPNNYKYHQPRHENIEFKSRQHNPYHPYKRSDECHEKKEYKNIYNEQSGHGRDRKI